MTNKRTWYAHLFRTQGGDFAFPFPLSGVQVQHARDYCTQLFLNNEWAGQIRPLSWLLEKFKPLPDWHDGKDKGRLEIVMKKGEEFYAKAD